MTSSFSLRALVCATALSLITGSVDAAVVGHNPPALSLTQARIADLSGDQAALWSAYLARSLAQEAADKAALASERRGLAQIPPPPAEGHGETMPLDRPDAWYATKEARHIADVIVSFQTPAGGWGKNQRRDGELRQTGQAYVADNISKFLAPDDYDTPHDPQWNYVGTLDNNATTTEMRFLAKVAAQAPGPEGDAYRVSFLKGVQYLLNAQYPNGGWPQVWPLEGGYHDGVTYNDNAVALAAMVLSAAATGQDDYAFVPQDVRKAAAEAAARAVQVILATQVKADGVATIWAQQYDPLTLQPESARNFEPPSIASDESSDVLMFLMQTPDPSPAVVTAVRDAVAWLKAHELRDVAWTRTDKGRDLIPSPGAGPIWARYYDVDTGKPVFGDRDKSLYDNVDDLSYERRNGYNWFDVSPQKVLDAYTIWTKAHPAK
ncbi:MAG: pectate lyase [Asticcacaulis sp.]|uniref:pectate lyase n=1 Tax=Asticcacaulis sp. TaxID=1872648 RepID=UPI003F7B746B